MLLKYKSLEFKVPRDNKSAWDEIIGYIIESVGDDAEGELNNDIEFEGYWPGHDEDFNRCFLSVHRHEEKVFTFDFTADKLSVLLKQHLKPMRFLN